MNFVVSLQILKSSLSPQTADGEEKWIGDDVQVSSLWGGDFPFLVYSESI
jgi:hypothetical protein